MADVNECRWQSLTNILGRGGQVSEMQVEYVTSLIATRYPIETPLGQLSDLWQQLFNLDGFILARNDNEFNWLVAEGAVGADLNALWESYWCDIAGGGGGGGVGTFNDAFSDAYA
jgi:hypothetical protein